MKTCFKCGITKDFSEFYKHKQMADGHLNKCKECTKKDVKTNYVEHIEQFKEYEKKRANLPHRIKAREDYAKTASGISAGNSSKKSWMLYHPIQRAASQIVSNAVRDGKISKPCNCSECGKESKRLEGHHDDYAFPLSVRWLCRKCHVAWHSENKPLNGD